MNVNELLDTIEDALEESANVPLSGGKRIVDVEQIRDYLDEVRAALPGELRQAQQNVLDEVEAVDIILHAHIERRGDGAFLLVAMDRQVAVGTLVGQLMDQGRVTMECEDDRLILGEQSIVISVRQAMRMLGVGLKLHQVNNVDNADLQFGHCVAQDGDSSQSFRV